jgi:outer membrane protein assembly factor BamD
MAVVWMVSCTSNYTKLTKSTDKELKYKAAKEYFAKRHYMKAYTLLEDVAAYYKGTPESDEVLFLLAESYYRNNDYAMAHSYYKTYTRTFPRENHAEECRFMMGKALYDQTPDYRLDQTNTREAISALEDYVQLYPDGKHLDEANRLIGDMRDRLAHKAYSNAKLYYNLGNYLGNNYVSAVVTAENALKDFPESQYREDLSFLILQSKYQQMVNSFEDKKKDRARATEDEYYNFVTDYPSSKHRQAADRIKKDVDKVLH